MEPLLAKTPTGLQVETTKPFLVSLMDAFNTRGYTLPWKGALALNTLFCKETLQYTVNDQSVTRPTQHEPHNCCSQLKTKMSAKTPYEENLSQ